MESSILLQLTEVEHVIKAAIIVGNDIKDDMTIVLESVNMMVDNHCSSVVLGLHLFTGLFVYQVDKSLLKE